jgi:hypothetical protein
MRIEWYYDEDWFEREALIVGACEEEVGFGGWD